MVVQDLQVGSDIVPGSLMSILAELDPALDGEDELHDCGFELEGGEVQPLVNQTLLEVVLTIETFSLLGAGQITKDSIAFEDKAVSGLKDWDLAEGVLLKEVFFLKGYGDKG